MNAAQANTLQGLTRAALERCNRAQGRKEACNAELSKLEAEWKELQEQMEDPELWSEIATEPLAAAQTEVHMERLRSLAGQVVEMAERIGLLRQRQELVQAEVRAAGAALDQLSLLYMAHE